MNLLQERRRNSPCSHVRLLCCPEGAENSGSWGGTSETWFTYSETWFSRAGGERGKFTSSFGVDRLSFFFRYATPSPCQHGTTCTTRPPCPALLSPTPRSSDRGTPSAARAETDSPAWEKFSRAAGIVDTDVGCRGPKHRKRLGVSNFSHHALLSQACLR